MPENPAPTTIASTGLGVVDGFAVTSLTSVIAGSSQTDCSQRQALPAGYKGETGLERRGANSDLGWLATAWLEAAEAQAAGATVDGRGARGGGSIKRLSC